MRFKVCRNIFRSDMKKLARNWIAIVIAAGIALLPSLYAWVNILASWDPYGNTKGIKIGVVNEDTGASIQDITLNIGDDLVEELRENEKLGWTFFDTREEGIESTRVGDTYATIIIPKDFSRNLATLVDDTPVKPQLDYYVNEKINAIAPKMTDSGANTLQKQISESFIQTVVEKFFDAVNPLGYSMDENYDKIQAFHAFINLVDGDLPEVESHINHLLQTAEDGKVKIDEKNEDVVFLKSVLGNAVTYSNNVGDSVTKLNEKTAESVSDLKANLKAVDTTLGDMQTALSKLGNTVGTEKPNLVENINTLSKDLQKMENKLTFIADEYEEVFGERLNVDGILRSIDDIDDRLEEAIKFSSSLDEMNPGLKTLEASVGKLSEDLTQISNTIDAKFASVDAVLEKLEQLVRAIENKVDPTEILQLIAQIDAMLQTNPELYQHIMQTIAQIKEKLNLDENLDYSVLKLSNQIESLRNTIKMSKLAIGDKLSTVKDSLQATKIVLKGLQNIMAGASSTTTDAFEGLRTQLDKVNDKVENVKDVIQASEDADISTLSDSMRTLSSHVSTLEAFLAKVQNALANNEDVEKLLADGEVLCATTRDIVNKLYIDLDDKTVEKIQSMLTNIGNASGDVSEMFSRGIRGLDDVSGFVHKLNNDPFITVSDIERFKEKYPSYLADASKITSKLKTLLDEVDVRDIASILQNDSGLESDFFSSPVLINTNKLFPIQNYGAGLTPFYTTLCLWVGALLLCALFSTKAHNADFEFTPNEEYLGKYMLFGLIAFVQGIIAAVGDVLILGVQMEHPLLFIALAGYYSIIFSIIVYTCVSLLDNVGKAVGVVLLVLQLAGAGGTFPIEVTPKFFQYIHRFLPFTYAIGGMREAVGGIVYENLMLDIAVLAIYGAVFLALGLLLKRYTNDKLQHFVHKLGESGIIGH